MALIADSRAEMPQYVRENRKKINLRYYIRTVKMSIDVVA